jgi:hypothetical protein
MSWKDFFFLTLRFKKPFLLGQSANESLLQLGARLGCVKCMSTLGSGLFDERWRWRWLAEAASRGDSSSESLFFMGIVTEVGGFSWNPVVVYQIGRGLSKRRRFMNRFEDSLEFEAIEFYKRQSEAARAAVNAWTLVGLKLRIVKDIRKYIGAMVWDARDESQYLDPRKTPVCEMDAEYRNETFF